METKVSVCTPDRCEFAGERPRSAPVPAAVTPETDTFVSSAAPWPTRYLGRPFSADRDCATLVEEVLATEFGVHVSTPGRAASHGARARQIGEGIERLARPVETPADGDVVLMARIGRRRAAGRHVGVWWQPPRGEGHVLHALAGVGATLHPASRLAGAGLVVVGTYRVRAAP